MKPRRSRQSVCKKSNAILLQSYQRKRGFFLQPKRGVDFLRRKSAANPFDFIGKPSFLREEEAIKTFFEPTGFLEAMKCRTPWKMKTKRPCGKAIRTLLDLAVAKNGLVAASRRAGISWKKGYSRVFPRHHPRPRVPLPRPRPASPRRRPRVPVPRARIPASPRPRPAYPRPRLTSPRPRSRC